MAHGINYYGWAWKFALVWLLGNSCGASSSRVWRLPLPRPQEQAQAPPQPSFYSCAQDLLRPAPFPFRLWPSWPSSYLAFYLVPSLSLVLTPGGDLGKPWHFLACCCQCGLLYVRSHLNHSPAAPRPPALRSLMGESLQKELPDTLPV